MGRIEAFSALRRDSKGLILPQKFKIWTMSFIHLFLPPTQFPIKWTHSNLVTIFLLLEHACNHWLNLGGNHQLNNDDDDSLKASNQQPARRLGCKWSKTVCPPGSLFWGTVYANLTWLNPQIIREIKNMAKNEYVLLGAYSEALCMLT